MTKTLQQSKDEIKQVLATYNIPAPKTWQDASTGKPKPWARCTLIEQLDYISTRILAKSRTTTSHRLMREEGVLSVSQYNRRRAREVYSQKGSLEDVMPGVFSRVHNGEKSPRKGGGRVASNESTT